MREHHRVLVFGRVAGQEVIEPGKVYIHVVFEDHDPACIRREATGLLQGTDLVHPDHEALDS